MDKGSRTVSKDDNKIHLFIRFLNSLLKDPIVRIYVSSPSVQELHSTWLMSSKFEYVHRPPDHTWFHVSSVKSIQKNCYHIFVFWSFGWRTLIWVQQYQHPSNHLHFLFCVCHYKNLAPPRLGWKPWKIVGSCWALLTQIHLFVLSNLIS